jgi:penicillin-binding protein 1B
VARKKKTPLSAPMNQERTSGTASRWKKGVFTTFLICLTVLLSFTVGATGVAAGFVASLVKSEPVRSKEDLSAKISSWSQTSQGFFRDGSPIGYLRADADRKVVTVNDVSPYLIDALISTEDREFYQHNGVVPRSLIRAGLQSISGSSVQTGGSTLTQQLVKNTILENRDKSYERKAKEIFLAIRMDRLFSKEEILNAYLNSLYFGKGASGRNMLGVQAAAKGLFGVDAKDLTLPQAAYIAGMVQRPNDYNPFMGDKEKSLKRGTERMHYVLKKMLDNKKINKAEYHQAIDFDIKGSLAKREKENAYAKYPYLTMTLEDEAAKRLMEADGLDAEKLSKEGKYQATLQQYKAKVLTGGYQIHTTIDKKLYDAMNKAAQNDKLYAAPITYTAGGKTIKNAKEQVGATLIDVKTGALLGFVGGRNFDENQANHALDYPRQPGSTIKPLLDYGPGLDRGVISPDSIVIDEPLATNRGKVYQNYTKKYDGPMTAREALKRSLNIPAIKVLRRVGVQTGLDYLRKMDFPVHEYDGEASAIGGFTYGFTVDRLTAGYAMLGNQGKFNEPYLIEKITDPTGKTVYQHKGNPVQVMSPQAAYWTTDMLRDVLKSGTGTYVGSRAAGYDLAGKTGTTSNTYDVWFMGYTPDIALGVWVGYDYNHRLPWDMRAKVVWSEVFQAVTQTDPNLSPKGHRFASQPKIPFKCFECNRAKKMKEDKDKKKKDGKKERGQPEQNRPPQPPNIVPPPSGNDGSGGQEPPVITPFEPPNNGGGGGNGNGRH